MSKKSAYLNHPLIQNRLEEVQVNINQIIAGGFSPQQFCLMPFVNIILEPNGSVGLCRHKGTEHSLGNLKEQTWQEIWNGTKAQQWRQEFLEGRARTCRTEIDDQGCNLCPQLGKMFPDDPKTLKAKTSNPLRLTANFNGFCNLQCQMCDVWELPNGFYTDENFWNPARKELFPHLREIDMLSGEPFLQQDTYRLIDEVSLVNPNCLWSITTNAHWNWNTRVESALEKIKIKNIILSVDSFDPETYHKIRKPGILSKVLKTIDHFREYEEKRIKNQLTPLHMNLNFLVQKDNWREIPNALHYCLSRNIHPFITFCYRPSEHSLLTLSQEKRSEIIGHMLSTYTWDELCLSHRVLSPLIHSLPAIDKVYALDTMKRYKKEYEARAN
ncbi:MAG: radical SAM protein [Bdellovibrionota bacterium]|nr:radical SAM protein [Bdellovibrionota bacterium]